jgi:hypothetical protein
MKLLQNGYAWISLWASHCLRSRFGHLMEHDRGGIGIIILSAVPTLTEVDYSSNWTYRPPGRKLEPIRVPDSIFRMYLGTW